MKLDHNLHASIPPTLLAEAERLAAEKHVTLDELMQNALIRYLDDSKWRDLYAYGEEQARKHGVSEADVERIVHEFREEQQERKDLKHAG